jgi:hypothetical protein
LAKILCYLSSHGYASSWLEFSGGDEFQTHPGSVPHWLEGPGQTADYFAPIPYVVPHSRMKGRAS